MSWRHYVFIGPYAAWVTSETRHFETDTNPVPVDLLEGGPLHWNISYSTALPPITGNGKKKRYHYCCGQREERRGQPRWPMLFEFADGKNQEIEIADWTDVRPRAEIRWFTKSFSRELGLLAAVFREPPALHWGLVYMET